MSAQKVKGPEAIEALPAIIAKVYRNEMFSQKVAEIEYDRAAIEKVREILGKVKTKMDEQLKTQRQVKGEDHLASIPLWRKPRESKEQSDPLAEFLD